MFGKRAVLASLAGGWLVTSTVAVLEPAAQATPPTPMATTIDFSTVNQGPFDQASFKADSVIFTDGTFFGFSAGHNALIGGTPPARLPVAGNVRGGFAQLSAQVAPAFQGVATYTLAAFKNGTQIAATSITVKQIQGDPTSDPLGYFKMSLGPLSKKADAFSLSDVFVSSPNPDLTSMEFGVSTITFSK